MQKKKTEAVIIILCGLVCLAAACYVYFTAYTIYADSGSSRVQDLNRFLKTFGKTGTAIIIAIPGLIAVYAGLKKWSSKN